MAYEAKTNWKLDDTVMPEDLNRIEQGIVNVETNLGNKATSKHFTATIPVTGWSAEAPYTIEIPVEGMLESDKNFPISPVYADDLYEAQSEAWSKVSYINAGADKIIVTCKSELPTTAIPIQITVVR